MKQIVFFLLLSGLGFKVAAQTEQGNFLAGGNVQLNTSAHNTIIQVSPTIGYFFVDNFVGGGILNISHTKSGVAGEAARTTNFSIGPFVRYYVGNANVHPFLQGDVEFRSTRYKTGTERTTLTGTDFFVGPGAAFFLNRNVALEALAGYTHTANKDEKGSGGFAFKLGFQVYINRAQMKATSTVQ